MTSTEQYINTLTNLKAGELGLLRLHAGQGLDESVKGFDLFTGIWWPLRSKNQRAPRRQVAWLIAKLYACCPIPHLPGKTLAYQMGCLYLNVSTDKEHFQQRFDRMLILPLGEIEPALRWAIDLLHSKNLGFDWVKLTDDLSIWERESKRYEWAKQFLEGNKYTKEEIYVD
jgi:CRISPR type I-E-associated protein CasB/Cse2